MGDGILDYLTNNWQTILGSEGAGPPQMGTQPQAPPQAPPGVLTGQPFSPSAAVGPNPLTGSDPTTMASLNGGALPSPAPGPGSPTPQMPDATLAGMSPAASGTPTNPNQFPPPNSTSTMGAPPPGMPTPGAPPGAPPGVPPGRPQFVLPNAPPSAGGGGIQLPPALASQLGATAPPPVRSNNGALPTFLAALGKGLTNVGAQRPGTNAGAAFAGGMGGALTGGSNFQQEQQKDALAQHKQFFDETIASDNQSMKAAAFPYNIQHLAASTGLLQSQQNRMTQTGGSNAWQLSDVGRLRQADQETDTWYKQQIQGLQLLKGVANQTKLQTRLDQIEAQKEKVQQQNYQKYQVNPKTAKGVSQDQPIDASKMNLSQMQTMPAGTWFSYVDKDGKQQVTTRKADQYNTPELAQQAPQQQPPSYTAQQEAMNPAAVQ
jgi:hypothetical protein